MKKPALIFLSILLFSHISKAQDSAYTIIGHFEKIKNGTIFLDIYEGDQTIKKSALINDGSFKFTGFVSSPFFASLTMPVRSNYYFTFYIEPVSISISGRGDSLKMLSVKGSIINDDDRLLKERMTYVTQWEDTDSKIYEEAYKNNNKQVMTAWMQ